MNNYPEGAWFPRAVDPKTEVQLRPDSSARVRTFGTGATRNLDDHKYDFEAFLSPAVLEEYGRYMHGKRMQANGQLRDGDNWQKGIPFTAYAKSLVRHTFDFWRAHRGYQVTDKDTNLPVTKLELLMAILFNVMGYAHELLAGSQDTPYPERQGPEGPR